MPPETHLTRGRNVYVALVVLTHRRLQHKCNCNNKNEKEFLPFFLLIPHEPRRSYVFWYFNRADSLWYQCGLTHDSTFSSLLFRVVNIIWKMCPRRAWMNLDGGGAFLFMMNYEPCECTRRGHDRTEVTIWNYRRRRRMGKKKRRLGAILRLLSKWLLDFGWIEN